MVASPISVKLASFRVNGHCCSIPSPVISGEVKGGPLNCPHGAPPYRTCQANYTMPRTFNEGSPKVQPAAVLLPLPHAMPLSSDGTTALEAATGCDSMPSSPPLQETRPLCCESTVDRW
jgi:hypothetical protein